MRYHSLNKKVPKASFKEAVIKGLAPDNGLYFPEQTTPLATDFIQNLNNLDKNEIAYEAIRQFVGEEIPKSELEKIIAETLSFDFPLVRIDDNISTLELFHGPTMAFKDVGARFMARCLGYFNRKFNEQVTVLVATSGDTGSAVANGFLNVKGVDVVILYPSGKVSNVQEKQLTTLEQNITALEINGTFDDCQQMAKQAFLDSEITKKKKLTSANSINVARWLPQMFYYFLAYQQLPKNKKIVCSVPSGNFGNICAGLMAKTIGLPIDYFIASTNVNDVVPDYFATRKYIPKKSKKTISNAMDVGNPSNFVRILEIFEDDFNLLSQSMYAYSFSDDETRTTIQHLFQQKNYMADPHGAVGYLGLKKYLEQHDDMQGFFLETAHPVKFLDVVEPLINTTIDLPQQVKSVIDKEKQAVKISSYSELKDFLLS